MKFKIGSKVKIKKKQELLMCEFIKNDMLSYAEQEATIIDTVGNSYTLDVDENDECRRWSWYADMIEPVKEVRIKYLEGAKMLEINPKGNCIDVYAYEDVFIPQFEMRLVSLGFAMELPEGKIAKLYPRSSTFKTWGCIQANSVGIIDSSYCGDLDIWRAPLVCIDPKETIEVEINPCLGVSHNQPGTWIRKGDKIAQFEIVDAMNMPTFIKVDSLENENRGGFGTSGTK